MSVFIGLTLPGYMKGICNKFNAAIAILANCSVYNTSVGLHAFSYAKYLQLTISQLI